MGKALKVLLILFVFCSASYGRVRVVASIWPLALMVRDVGGEYVDVDTLLPPGLSVHLWEMRPRDVLKIKRADLLVMVGCSAEPWLKASIAPRIWRLCDGVELKGGNPHVWLSFEVVEKRALDLADTLGRLDAEHADYFRAKAKSLVDSLRRLRLSFRSLPDTKVVSHHGAWVYLLPELGLDYVGSIEPAPHREPGPKRLFYLIKGLSSGRCRIVVSEWGHNERLARMIAKKSGACLATLYPLGRGDESSLVDFFARNLSALERCIEKCIR